MWMKIKYIVINVGAIALFALGWLLLDLSVGSNDRYINGLQTDIEKFIMISPFVYYAIIAIVDVAINEKVTQFGRHSRKMFFFIGGVIFLVGIVTSLIWLISGTTDSVSGTWMDFGYDYRGNFIFYAFYSILVLGIGLAVNLYIALISRISLKLITL